MSSESLFKNTEGVSQYPKLRIELFKNGLQLSSYFLHFDTLKVSSDQTQAQGQALGHLSVCGLIGYVDLGPGYIVVIHTQRQVFKYKETVIWNIQKALAIPLKFELAKQYFELHRNHDSRNDARGNNDNRNDCDNDRDDENEDEDEDDNEVNNDNEDNDRDPGYNNENDDEDESSIVSSQSSRRVRDSATEQTDSKNDIFFSKLGIYVNDLKSNPSLSYSKKMVTNSQESNADEINEKDYNSIDLSRSITIKGLPRDKEPQKSSNFARFLDKVKQQQLDYKTQQTYSISNSMIYKFERQLELFFCSNDFFYSKEINLTKEFTFSDGEFKQTDDATPNSFFFNKSMLKGFETTELALPLIQGFVGSFMLKVRSSSGSSLKSGQVLLISKRSNKRAGSRYLRRGIDDDSNVANFVTTSQTIIIEDELYTKFDIIRGSIPLFFNQNPADLKPVPKLTRDLPSCEAPFKRHFDRLASSYGAVTSISLVEKSNREIEIGESYAKLCELYKIPFTWFDFHRVCRKMKFDNVIQLLDYNVENLKDNNTTIYNQLENYGWSDFSNDKTQQGIFRINCIDCLDRTNLVSKFISEKVLLDILGTHELQIAHSDSFQADYNNLWADNGDYISRQYASTNALKGDYTRTSKRNYKGLINDAFLTMSRYYSGYISDYFKQCVVDYLLGNKNSEVFEEFESTLNVIDPNETIKKLAEKNSNLRQIIEQLDLKNNSSKYDEDLILLGSWSGIYCTMDFNKLFLKNNDPMDQISIILTNKLIFFVDFVKGKIKKMIKIRIGDIKELNYGTYILSTHSALSINPKRNVGLKFIVHASDNNNNSTNDFLAVKFPNDMEYDKVKFIIELISKTCHSGNLLNVDIVTEEEAKKNTNVLQVLEYRFKKMVWG